MSVFDINLWNNSKCFTYQTPPKTSFKWTRRQQGGGRRRRGRSKTYVTIFINVFADAYQWVFIKNHKIQNVYKYLRSNVNICVTSIRRAAHWIVNLKYFDFFIMLIIILSSVALAAEDPINDDSEWNNYLDVVDNVFTVIFAIEMILKVRYLYFARKFFSNPLCLIDQSNYFASYILL